MSHVPLPDGLELLLVPKRILFDRRKSGWQDNFKDLVAIVAKAAQSLEAFRESEVGEREVAEGSPRLDVRYGVQTCELAWAAKRDIHERGTPLKRPTIDGVEAFGKIDGLQLRAAIERIPLDADAGALPKGDGVDR